MVRKDAKGNIIGYFLSLTDMWERKQTEEQLKDKMVELEEFHNLAIGRELKMIELEKEVNLLLSELGRQIKYKE